jgi:hypothetical protein
MMSDSTSTQKTYPLSVVIPTLGGETLAGTIEQLNCGTIVPSEILVCIPEEEAFRVKDLSYPNVRVIKTKCRGQVIQRIEGFKQAKCEYIVQLDDDMHVYESCLERLVQAAVAFRGKAALSPALVFTSSQTSAYRNQIQDKIPKTIKQWIHGRSGCVPGSLSRTGMNFGIDVSKQNNEFVSVDWLPGACVIHHRNNLILKNYYPFKGKAYAEDVIHSIMLKKNVGLFIVKSALCGLDDHANKLSFTNIVMLHFFEYRVSKLIVTIISGSKIYMHLDKIIEWSVRLLKVLFRKLRKDR